MNSISYTIWQCSH